MEEKLWRPTLHNVGMLLYGCYEQYFIADNIHKKDSNNQCTCLCCSSWALSFRVAAPEALGSSGLRRSCARRASRSRDTSASSRITRPGKVAMPISCAGRLTW